MGGVATARATTRPRRAVTRITAPPPPLWRESLWPLDWMELRLSAVYRGVGVPAGDGSAVVLVPGFMSTDVWLVELYGWLRRLGYRPYMSRIGLNAECPDRLARRLVGTIEMASAESGGPVRIIGHSLGGLIGRSALIRRPDLVSQLVYLGSPVRSVGVHPALLATAALVRLAVQPWATGDRCLTESCSCLFGKAMSDPLPEHVQHAAIFSQEDGVVDWHDSVEADPRLNHEVGGTHVGLVFNPRAYAVLARLLAEV